MVEKNKIDYSKYTLTELLDIYSRVNQTFNKDSALAIETEIHKRTGMDREAIENEIKSLIKSKVHGRKKRNTHLTVISWILIIYSGFTLLTSLVGFIVFLFFDSSTFNKLGSNSSVITDFFLNNMYVQHLPTIIIATLFIYFTSGLFKLDESSRENTVYLLWFSLFWNIVWGIFIYKFLTIPMMTNAMAMMDIPQMGFFQSSSYAAVISGNLIPSIIIGYFIYKLSSREIRREFEV
ncbi:MAG: hypothetical protein PVH88_27195 [Ignavibacteria bacterium]|jgi:hypothetical protein